MNKDQILSFLHLLRPIDLNITLSRLGSINDGGYLVPSNFADEIDTCFSLGIGNNDSFDLSCVINGVNVHQIDPTIENPPHSGDLLNFYPKAFGMFQNERHLSFDDLFIVTRTQSENIMVKMDVEGGEWAGILFSSKEALSKIKIITGEFHNLRSICDVTYFNLFFYCFSRLNRFFYPIFIKANDLVGTTDFYGITIPDCVEITYVSTNYISRPVPFENNYIKYIHHLATSTDKQKPQTLWHPSQYF